MMNDIPQDPSPEIIAQEAEAVRASWSIAQHFYRWQMAPTDLARKLIAEGHPEAEVNDHLEFVHRQIYNARLLKGSKKRAATIAGWYEVPRDE